MPSSSGAGTCSSSSRRWPRPPLPLEDYSFIDHLWQDWSPGYDGAWDVARVKESIGDPEHIVAAISYYRGALRPVAPGARTGRGASGVAPADAEADPVPARSRRQLHAPVLHRLAPRLPGRRDPRWRSSTAPATSSTSSGQTSSTRASSSSSPHPDGASRPAPSSPQPQRRRSALPDQRANPSSTSAAAIRSARAASSGQPHARAPRTVHPALSQGIEEASPPLPVRAGKGALGSRRW